VEGVGVHRGQNPAFLWRNSIDVVDVLCAVQPEPQGENTICGVPGDGLPHARLARPAGTAEAGDGSQRARRGARGDKLSLTTPDRKYTIRTVACFGQCALAPVVEINHAIYAAHRMRRACATEIDVLEKENGN